MKQTLLEIVQRVAEYIDGETINSIGDTRESSQIATIVKETYQYLIQTRQINTRDTIVHFDDVNDTQYKPNYLTYQDTVFEIFDLQYKDLETGRYSHIQYIDPEVFLQKALSLDPNDENVIQVKDYSDIFYYIRNDKQPQYYTSFDDVHIAFDSYNAEVEDTIHDNNVIAQGRYMPEFKLEDDFVPNIAPQHFPLLLSKSKEIAGVELKEYVNPLEADRAAKLTVITNKLAHREIKEPRIWHYRKNSGRK